MVQGMLVFSPSRIATVALEVVRSSACASCNCLVFNCSVGTAKRQLYLGPSDVLLPESNSDFPAPIVSPSGVVPAAGAVPAALAIAPSPLIGPAPAILPSDAIKEKNRATPMEDQGSLS